MNALWAFPAPYQGDFKRKCVSPIRLTSLSKDERSFSVRFTRIVTVTLLCFLSFSVSAGTFIETFDDKNLEAWKELVHLNKAPGSWEVINDELHAVSRETFRRLLITGDNTWENYTIEFDVKPLTKHGVGTIVIAARVSGTWVVSCNIDDRVELIDGEAVPGTRISCDYGDWRGVEFISLHSAAHPLLRLDKWAHLKLSVQGGIVTFWIDRKQVMEPTKLQIFREVAVFRDFPDFLTGGVGFGLSNYTARFDNITVTGDTIPNSGGFAVTSQGKLATTWGNLKRF